MANRNCPNCAAPYEINLNKCPYCGTSYYDLSALDFTTHEPFYLKIKTEMNGMPCYITQLVRLNADMSMEFSSETVECRNACGRVLCTFPSNNTLTTNISFQAVVSPEYNNLCTIELKEVI